MARMRGEYFSFLQKRFLCFFLCVLLMGVLPASKAFSDMSTNSVFWVESAAQEGSTVFSDSSASQHTIVANGETHHATSGIDTAILFDGAGDYLRVDDSSDWDLGSQDFTIEMWIKFSVAPDAAIPVGLISTQSAGTEYGYRFEIVNGTLNWFSRSPEFGLRLSTDVTPEADRWYHIAAVRSGDLLTLYVDGTAAASQNIAGLTLDTAGGGLVIGRITSGTDGYYFNGQMDEIGVTKGEARWTADFMPESLLDYQDSDNDGLFDSKEAACGTNPDMADSDGDGIGDNEEYTYWGDPGYLINHDSDAIENNLLDADSDNDGINDGDEITAGTDPADSLSKPDLEKLYVLSDDTDNSMVFSDSSLQAHTITANGDVHHATSGIDTAIAFDGAGDYLSIADSGDWDLEMNNFTIEMWVNFSEVPDANTPVGLFSTQSAGTEYGYRLEVVNGTLNWFSRSPEAGFRLSTGVTPAADTWYHIAAVRYGDQLTLYVDGQARASVSVADISMNTAGGGVVIGRITSGTDGYYFSGQMDEIRLRNGEARWFGDFTPETYMNYQDTDNDGLYDLKEAACGTNPNLADTDGDGIDDYQEYAYWGDPGYLNNFDGDAIDNNLLDADADNDGISDGYEINAGYDPSDSLSTPYMEKLKILSSDTDGSTVFTDGSRSAHAITANGDVRHAVFAGSSAIAFDGAGDYLSLSDSEDWDFNEKDFTIDMWVKFAEVPDAASPVGLLSTQSSGTEYGYRIEVVDGTLNWFSRSPESGFRLSSGVTPEADRWYHIAAVRADNLLTLYVDGLARGSQDLTGVNMDTAGGGMVVGRIVSGADGYYFNGQISDIRVNKDLALWTADFGPDDATEYQDTDGDGINDPHEPVYGTDPNVADTDADGVNDGTELAYWGEDGYLVNHDGDAIQNNLLDADSDGDGVNDGEEIAANDDPTDPQSFPYTEKLYIWSDDTQGSTLFTDSSFSAHPITANGDVHHALSGTDTAIMFDGAGDYLSIADSEDWDFGSENFTIDLWVSFTTVPDVSAAVGLLSTQTSGSDDGYRLEVINGMLSWFSKGPASTFRLSTDVTPVAGEWCHVAAVRSDGQLTLYVNGQARASRDLAGETMDTAGGGMVIGRIVSGTDDFYLSGQLDEIRVNKGEALWTADFTPPNRPVAIDPVYIDANNNGLYDSGESAFNTIEAAVSAAADSQIIRVTDGVYILGATLTIDKPLSIIGQSETGVVIDASGNGSGYGILVDANDVTLQNFTLLPPTDGAVPPASGVYPIHTTFDDSAPAPHTNLVLSGITIENSYRTAFDVHGFDNVTLTNLTARNAAFGNGISLTGCTNAVVTGCVTENNAWGGIAFYVSESAYLNRGCSNITFDFSVNSIGEYVYVEDEFGLLNDVSVLNATYSIRNDYAVDASMLIYTNKNQTSAEGIAADLNTRYGNTLSMIRDLSSGSFLAVAGLISIQAAIDATADGGTILLGAGVYDETVNIESRSDLTLMGVNKNTVVLKSGSTLPWNVGTYGTSRQAVVRNVGSTNIVFQDMTIDMDLAKGDYVFALMGWDSSVTMFDMVVRNNQVDDALSVFHELGCYFKTDTAFSETSRADIVIRDCVFENAGRVAIDVHDHTNALITNNQIYKTEDDFGYGIEVGSKAIATIRDNIIYGFDKMADTDGSVSAGVYIENAFTGGDALSQPKTVTVETNDIHGCQNGIWIGNSHDGFAGDVDIVVSLIDNDIYGNNSFVNPNPLQFPNVKTSGITIQDEDASDGSSVTVTGTGNTISDNGNYGVRIFTYGDGNITVDLDNEMITGNNTGLYLMETASGSTYNVAIHNSDIDGNTSYGVNNTISTIVVDAENNWWGAADGPGGAGPGSGDAVSDYVDFDPWL